MENVIAIEIVAQALPVIQVFAPLLLVEDAIAIEIVAMAYHAIQVFVPLRPKVVVTAMVIVAEEAAIPENAHNCDWMEHLCLKKYNYPSQHLQII